jgi:hypothetical protein
MNSIRQFWTLLKFQASVNPFIWFMPLALGTPLYISHIMPSSYHPNLSTVLGVQNLFFVGILGTMVIAPERFQLAAANAAWSSGTEFLLTRAIDRPVLYRSKAAFLYVLVLLIPLVSLFSSLKSPDLKVTEYSDLARKECLAAVPGSSLQKDPNGSRSPLIFIPRGSVLVEEWHLWLFLVSTAAVQALILLLYPVKWRLLIFYLLFITFIFAPLFWELSSIHTKVPSPSLYEGPFFLFSAHPFLFWFFTAGGIILAQLWCERRFAQMEQ